MAHLTWHGDIIRVWKSNTEHTRYHLTETGWLLRTSGPRLGNAKVVAKPKDEERKNKIFHYLSDITRFHSEVFGAK